MEDPIQAAPFIPLLLPALEKAADSVSDPEARSVCDRGLNQLKRLNNEILKVGDVGKTDPAVVSKIVEDALSLSGVDSCFAASLNFLCVVGGSMIDFKVKDTGKWGQTNRLLTGPYETARAAQAVVSELAGQGVDSFRFTSQEGEEIQELD